MVWSRGVPGPGGGERGVPGPGGVPDRDPPGQLLLRAVRILLECILVLECDFPVTNSMIIRD